MHFCCHLHLIAHALSVISYRDETHCIWVSIFSVGDVAQMTQEGKEDEEEEEEEDCLVHALYYT